MFNNMIFNRRDLSDDDYVDLIRNRDRTLSRIWWLWLVLVALCLGTLIYFRYASIEIIQDLGSTDTTGGFILGAVFGFLYVGICTAGAVSLRKYLESRSGHRTERLLLKYYEELKNIEEDRGGKG